MPELVSRPLRVFLCHSSNDKSTVRELYRRLNAEDWIDAWLDEEKLFPGQDWDREIQEALDSSDAVIVALSTGSVSKEGYVQKELRYVLDLALEKPDGSIFILPIRLDDCERPRKLRSVQDIDYFPSQRQERAYVRIQQSLELRANKLGIKTPRQLSDVENPSQLELLEVSSVTRANRYVYWFCLTFPILLQVGLGYYFYHIWLNHPTSSELAPFWQAVLFWLKILSFFPLLWALFTFFGLIQGHPRDVEFTDDDLRWDQQALLVVSYVSKGENQKALNRSLQETQKILDAMNVSYEIEVITDISVTEKLRVRHTKGPIYYYLVPQDYEVRKNSVKYKARALQYSLSQRDVRFNERGKTDLSKSDVWILHLDEESIITHQAIIGIENFVEKYSLRKSGGAIGQGEILYNSYKYGDNILLTAIDSLRTGDDLGRFRFQYIVAKKPVIGMHGSFMLMPAVLEKAIGWDWGSRSILAEDTYFAFKAMEKNVKFDWVNGFIREQSPFSIRDMIRQRMRWYNGLLLLVSDKSLKLSKRIVLGYFLGSWLVGWIGIVLFVLLVVSFFGASMPKASLFPLWAVLLTSWITGVVGAAYEVGVYRNLVHLRASLERKLYIALATYFLLIIQVLPSLEAVAVLYSAFRAIFSPLKDFPSIAKD